MKPSEISNSKPEKINSPPQPVQKSEVCPHGITRGHCDYCSGKTLQQVSEPPERIWLDILPAELNPYDNPVHWHPTKSANPRYETGEAEYVRASRPVGEQRQLFGELWIDNEGEAHFVCHTKNDDFPATKAAFEKFIALLQRQIQDEKECPFYTTAPPNDEALQQAPEGWLPISSAPKDRRILLRCVHINAQYAKDPIAEGWIAPVIGEWTTHNGGGWTWHGGAGELTHWMPLPSPDLNVAPTPVAEEQP